MSLAIVVFIAAMFAWSAWRAHGRVVQLVFIGYTNVNGNAMAQFEIQNHSGHRIWLRHVKYLLGDAFQEPAGAWQCPELAMLNRWGNAPDIPQQYIPPEPTPTNSDPTDLLVPVPASQRWRIGMLVEFNNSLSERVHTALKYRHWPTLDTRQFENNSAVAIWSESQMITSLNVQNLH